MADMHEYFRRSREYDSRSDTKSLESQFASLGPDALKAFKQTRLKIDLTARHYALCDDENEKRALEKNVSQIIANLIKYVQIPNGRGTLYKAMLYARFNRKKTEAKQKREE